MHCWIHKTRWLIMLLSVLFTPSAGQQSCTEGDVRIVDGPNEFEGRVEICITGIRMWGPVCGDVQWGIDDARVVCRQLGFSSDTPAVTIGGFYGVGDGPALIANVGCDGTESTLSDCAYDGATNCDSNVAQIVCQDPVCFDTPQHLRLVGGNSETEGRVEICSTSQFRRGVCDNNWDERDASVVCRELGLLLEDEDATFGGAVRYKSFVFDNASCDGTEQRISHCNFNQVDGRLTRCDFAGVVCRTQSSTALPATLTTTSTLAPSPTVSLTVTPIGSGPGSSSIEQVTDSVQMSTQTDSTSTMLQSSPVPSSTSSVSTPTDSVIPQGDPANNALTIGIALGVVGGLLALLVVVILVVVCTVIVGRKHKRKITYETQHAANFNGHPKNLENITTVSVTAATTELHNNGTSEYEPTQRELLNPIYRTTGLLTPPLDSEAEQHQTGYAELEEVRTNTATRILVTETPNYYSSPTPPILEKTTPQEYSEPTVSRATTDVEGYASLESPHLYDDTLHPELSTPYPYETPMSPSSLKVDGGTNVQSENNGGSVEDYQEPHLYEIPTVETAAHKDEDATASNSHPYATLERPT